MAQAIAIIHKRGPSPWLDDLLESIHTHYPVLITNHDGWMIDGIRKSFETTPFDEIFFLNETMVVKDNAIWDMVFEEYAGSSVAVGDGYLMSLGKYLRKYVEQTNFPTVHNKHDDVMLGEFGWNGHYKELDPDFIQVDPMTDTFERFEEKHGRTNMILENQYFIKWKHTYDTSMIDE